MALVTFSNVAYRDKTVYAVAGSHTETVLKVAKTNKIPINFNCEDGQCGSCLIRVSHLAPRKTEVSGGPLTQKEISVLREQGKITQEEIDNMAVDDLPTQWRLACQMVVRDEDVLVHY
jgi:ferredoxin